MIATQEQSSPTVPTGNSGVMNVGVAKQRKLDHLYAEKRDACLFAVFVLGQLLSLPELVQRIMLDLKLLHMLSATRIKCEEGGIATAHDLMLHVAHWPQPHTTLRWEVQVRLIFDPRDDYTGYCATLFSGAWKTLQASIPPQRIELRPCPTEHGGLCWNRRLALQWYRVNLSTYMGDGSDPVAHRQLTDLLTAMLRASYGVYGVHPIVFTDLD